MKPIGDIGQRFKVTYYDPAHRARRVFGWTDSPAHRDTMVQAIRNHPTWRGAEVIDRQGGTRERTA